MVRSKRSNFPCHRCKKGVFQFQFELRNPMVSYILFMRRVEHAFRSHWNFHKFIWVLSMAYCPFLRKPKLFLEKNQTYISFVSLSNFFSVQQIRGSSSVGLSILLNFMQRNGWNLTGSRRAIVVDPYFASISFGHDVTLTSFSANPLYVRAFCLHIGCKIGAP